MVEHFGLSDSDDKSDDQIYREVKTEDNYMYPHDDQLSYGNSDVEAYICCSCLKHITDRYYLLACDKIWHIHCLKCKDCDLVLNSEKTCYAKDGNIYCKEDYYRRFAVKKCSRCHTGISATDLVMRARDLVFHISCFMCATCNCKLTTGDYFGMKDDNIYCRLHYGFPHDDFLPSISPPTQHPGPTMPYYNGVGTTHKGRPRKRKSTDNDPHSCLQQLGLGVNENDQCHLDIYGHPQSQPPRQKRVRTSFKHHQLRTMKSYFALNHNPDAKDLKQLAQKTGLSKRVLQVWFQNARAKYRRNVLKTNGDGSVSIDGAGDLSSGGENSKLEDSPGSALMDIGNAGSPDPSDISCSSPSLSDIQNNITEAEHNSSGSSLTDIFTNGIKGLN